MDARERWRQQGWVRGGPHSREMEGQQEDMAHLLNKMNVGDANVSE